MSEKKRAQCPHVLEALDCQARILQASQLTCVSVQMKSHSQQDNGFRLCGTLPKAEMT